MAGLLSTLSQPVVGFTHFAVYDVVTAGETEILEPVWPFDQLTVSAAAQPVAVNVVELPEQILGAVGVTVGAVGNGFTATFKVALAGVEHETVPVPLQVAVYTALAVGVSFNVKPEPIVFPSLNQIKVPVHDCAVSVTLPPAQIALSETLIDGAVGATTTVIVAGELFGLVQVPTVQFVT